MPTHKYAFITINEDLQETELLPELKKYGKVRLVPSLWRAAELISAMIEDTEERMKALKNQVAASSTAIRPTLVNHESWTEARGGDTVDSSFPSTSTACMDHLPPSHSTTPSTNGSTASVVREEMDEDCDSPIVRSDDQGAQVTEEMDDDLTVIYASVKKSEKRVEDAGETNERMSGEDTMTAVPLTPTVPVASTVPNTAGGRSIVVVRRVNEDGSADGETVRVVSLPRKAVAPSAAATRGTPIQPQPQPAQPQSIPSAHCIPELLAKLTQYAKERRAHFAEKRAMHDALNRARGELQRRITTQVKEEEALNRAKEELKEREQLLRVTIQVKVEEELVRRGSRMQMANEIALQKYKAAVRKEVREEKREECRKLTRTIHSLRHRIKQLLSHLQQAIEDLAIAKSSRVVLKRAASADYAADDGDTGGAKKARRDDYGLSGNMHSSNGSTVSVVKEEREEDCDSSLFTSDQVKEETEDDVKQDHNTESAVHPQASHQTNHQMPVTAYEEYQQPLDDIDRFSQPSTSSRTDSDEPMISQQSLQPSTSSNPSTATRVVVLDPNDALYCRVCEKWLKIGKRRIWCIVHFHLLCNHLHIRPFYCPIDGCGCSFSERRTCLQHLDMVHSLRTEEPIDLCRNTDPAFRSIVLKYNAEKVRQTQRCFPGVKISHRESSVRYECPEDFNQQPPNHSATHSSNESSVSVVKEEMDEDRDSLLFMSGQGGALVKEEMEDEAVEDRTIESRFPSQASDHAKYQRPSTAAAEYQQPIDNIDRFSQPSTSSRTDSDEPMNSQQLLQPSTSSSSSTAAMVDPTEAVYCHVCEKWLKLGKKHLWNIVDFHLLSHHMQIRLWYCPINGCHFSANERHTCLTHLEIDHSRTTEEPVKLSANTDPAFRSIVLQYKAEKARQQARCFPGVKITSRD